MPRRPDILCAGTCGQMIWRATTSLPPGQAMCRACRAGRERPKKARRQSIDLADRRYGFGRCENPACLAEFELRTTIQRFCSANCRRSNPANVAMRRGNYRAKNYRRRTARRTVDITAAVERQIRAAAKTCPMVGCGVRMTDVPFRPNSKELDHIVPINVGGTHTIGNVRIICRQCNQRRPNDGSDYTGPVTLWSVA